MKKRAHNDFICTICGTEEKVPLCCGEKLSISGGTLVCDLCGTNKEVPICCGKNMKIVVSR